MPIELTCELPAQLAKPFDPESLARRLSALGGAGFERVILTDPDLPAPGLVRPAMRGSTMQLALTHQIGGTEPPAIAEQLSALDRESGARIALRLCGAAVAAEGHVAHWQRIDEFLVLLKRLWLNDRPFDHEGAFYRLQSAEIADKGVRGEIPIRIAGALSGTALKVAGRHADVFELSPGAPTEMRVLINRVRAAAAEWGRAGKIRFALPVEIGAHATPAQTAVQLLRYAELGIEEFVVRGSEAQLTEFGRETAPLLRNSLEAREPLPRQIIAIAPGVRLCSSRAV